MSTLEAPIPDSLAAPAHRARKLAGNVWNRWMAVLVGVATLGVYWITLSPGVSFWDAGEFIAASHSLGIPHPPGTPLYVLMGRFFSILLNGVLGVASVAQAVNLLSAIPAAISASVLYLCVVRVGNKIWNDGDQGTLCFPSIVAGVTAALFASFANTNWINAIESEVYAVSGMWAVVAAWLALLWADSEPKDERLLVLIAYLLSLNIAVHLATYLAALAILPFAFQYEKRLAIPISFLVVLAMAKDLQFFLAIVTLLTPATLQLALLSPEYTRQHRSTLLLAHVLATGVALWAILGLEPSTLRWVLTFGAPLAAFALPWIALKPPKELRNPLLDLGFLLTIVTLLGFSVHLYMPIRSALNPAINEAQPDTWKNFWDVILRQQYRPVSVFERQAEWAFQFDHMFWRYVREQWSPSFLWWAIGLPGLLLHYRKHRRTFVLFGMLFLWTSLMLVIKMNFTDHEVRERDYFFSPGYFYYGVWMGLGLGWACWLVIRGASSGLRPVLGGLAAALCLVLAVYPIRAGWETHDRRGNWIAHDYAHNMLAALDPNAVIFTNGDNDTFPLWYLQEVHGFRKDVRIVNLSLLNTPWYGEQLRDEEPKVPMTMTTEQIYELRPIRDSSTGQIMWVKDMLANDIVRAVVSGQATNVSDTERPVYFAVTVADNMGFDPYLNLEGLVYRFHPDSTISYQPPQLEPGVTPEAPNPIPAIVNNVNLQKTRRNLEEVYQYRGLLNEEGRLDPDVYRDGNEQKLVTNYAAAWAQMAIAYRALNQPQEAADCFLRAAWIAPHFDGIVAGVGGFLLQAGRIEDAREFYLRRLETHPNEITVYLGLGYVAQETDDWEEALSWFLRGARIQPGAPDVLAALYRAYGNLGRWEEAENVIVQWLQQNPNDTSARQILDDLRAQREQASSGETPDGE